MTQASLFSRVPATRARAAARRDAALARIVRQARQQWIDVAASHVLRWAYGHHGDYSPWLLEDARASYEDVGKPAPADGRWWGAVTRELARQGHIVRAGYGPAKSSNLSPKVLWRLR